MGIKFRNYQENYSIGKGHVDAAVVTKFTVVSNAT